MISRALTRKGTALSKLAKSSKDYDVAIETFQKALTEHRNPDTLKKLNEAERAKKELEQQEYYDPKIADEEREKGELFVITHSLFMQLLSIRSANDGPYLLLILCR
jgi:stress-induced-phosphoprotein 1